MSQSSDADSSVLDFLREQFARVHAGLDRFDTRLDEIVHRFGALQRDLAALKVYFAGSQLRFDTMSGRIERRLDLVG